jgi:predicted Zn-dependent peptidase
MGTFTRTSCGNEVYFNCILDSRFKTNRISVQFVVPLREETAAAYALLPNILRKRSANYPDFSAFNRMLAAMYGAYVDYGVDKIGDAQVIYLLGNTIDDRYTFDGEAVTEKLAGVLRELIFHPPLTDGCLDAEEVELEKTLQIDNLLAELNDKRAYAVRRSVEALCADDPHGLSKVGTKEQITALTAKQLTDAWQKLLSEARVEVCFTGCGDPKPVEEELVRPLTKLSREPVPFVANTLIRLPDPPLSTVEKMPVTQAKLVLHYATDTLAGRENTAPLQMMSMLLGGSPMSKLFVHVREEKSLCYYCLSRINNYKGLLTIESGVELHQVEDAKAAIFEQVEAMRQGAFTDEELHQATLYLENAYRSLYDAQASLESHYLRQVLVQEPESPEERIAKLQAVTRDEIIEAAQKLSLASIYLLTGEEA